MAVAFYIATAVAAVAGCCAIPSSGLAYRRKLMKLREGRSEFNPDHRVYEGCYAATRSALPLCSLTASLAASHTLLSYCAHSLPLTLCARGRRYHATLFYAMVVSFLLTVYLSIFTIAFGLVFTLSWGPTVSACLCWRLCDRLGGGQQLALWQPICSWVFWYCGSLLLDKWFLRAYLFRTCCCDDRNFLANPSLCAHSPASVPDAVLMPACVSFLCCLCLLPLLPACVCCCSAPCSAVPLCPCCLRVGLIIALRCVQTSWWTRCWALTVSDFLSVYMAECCC